MLRASVARASYYLWLCPDTAGPGEYNVDGSLKGNRATGAAFGRMRSGRVDLTKLSEPTPDPGHYQKPLPGDMDDDVVVAARPSAAFASKTGRKAVAGAAGMDVGPGAYNVTSATTAFKKKASLHIFISNCL